MRGLAFILALGVASPVWGDTNTVEGSTALDEALSILMAPTDSEDNRPEAEFTVKLNASNGLWEANNIPLSDAMLGLPVGKVILVHVTSSDTIYEVSFPELELDFVAIPGRIEEFWIEFNAPGLYHGACADPCETAGAPLTFDVQDPADR